MPEDPEVAAMSKVASALAGLPEDTQQRIIEWAAKKYSVILGSQRRTTSAVQRPEGGSPNNGAFNDFVDLYDAASPNAEPERALVGGYWFQEVQQKPSFGGQEVNNALKDVGHGVSNITTALTALQRRKPALVRQMAKSGRSKQARKTYKLTSAGTSAVQRLISGAASTEED